MDILNLIDKKKKGKALNAAEIAFFAEGAARGSIPDYQLASLLMAIRLKGMDNAEAFALTEAMASSGSVLDTSFAGGTTVDKHSTGGVSDTVTLVAIPALAAEGLKCVKMSGRGLSHTGGTVDKLEGIKNFKAELTESEIKDSVKRCGAVICAQTKELAPADKALYALRDVTGTVDSLPLIASSIMSKKLASGSDIILLDVKYGSGAFMKTAKEAVKLASIMVSIGGRGGKKCAAAITSMEQPLTPFIGCNLEVLSALSVLKGEKNSLYEVSKEVCARLFLLSGKDSEYLSACKRFEKCIGSGAALAKFREIIVCQGGDPSFIDDISLLPLSPNIKEVYAEKSGFVRNIDSEKAGRACCKLGGGREKKGDAIDHGAGLILYARLNQKISRGDKIALLYSSKEDLSEAEALVKGCVKISSAKKEQKKLIYAYVTADGTQLM